MNFRKSSLPVRVAFFIGILLPLFPGVAGPGNSVDTSHIEQEASRLLALDPTEQKSEVEKLSPTDARALRDFIRSRSIQANPSSGAIFYLYEHLANIAAIDLSEKRMQKLFLVFFITLFLFSAFLVYLLVTQNRLIRKLDSSRTGQKASGTAGSDAPPGSSVYKGEQDA